MLSATACPSVPVRRAGNSKKHYQRLRRCPRLSFSNAVMQSCDRGGEWQEELALVEVMPCVQPDLETLHFLVAQQFGRRVCFSHAPAFQCTRHSELARV